MAKKEKFIVTTPPVELGYSFLRTPDFKFNADGDYKLDFFMTEEQAVAFCESVEKDRRAVTDKGKKAKLKGTKVDGKIKFKTKQKSKITNKAGETFDVKPRLYYIVDGKTVPYPEDSPAPWLGSVGEVEVEIVPFDGFGGGLTMRPRAVRFHEIVEGTAGGTGNWADVEEGQSSSSRARPEIDEDEPDLDVEDEEDDEDGERW